MSDGDVTPVPDPAPLEAPDETTDGEATDEYVRPRYVVIRLSGEIRADSFDDLRALASEFSLTDLAERLDQFDLPAERLVRSISPAALRELEDEVPDDSPEPVSLTQYWRLDLRDGRFDPAEVADAMSDLRGVELAYVEPPVVDAFADSGTAALAPRRGGPLTRSLPATHLDASPKGINARWAWERGLDGTGVQLLDVESGWVFEHEALTHLQVPPLVAGVNAYDGGGDGTHGTAVLGLIAGEYVPPTGVTGICPRVGVLTASQYLGVDDQGHPADALADIVRKLTAGDIVLLEITGLEDERHMISGQRPIERDPASQNAIRLLTRRGIVVIEAAGNGDVDLDELATSGGLTQLNERGRGYADSGALMVGGAVVPALGAAASHQRWVGSNYGSRVTSYAWAQGVNSSGCRRYQWPCPPTSSYQMFNGTSAASAIIAGAAVLLQNCHRERRGTSLTSEQVRAVFADPDNGTDSVLDPHGRRLIGVMPDLALVAASLGLDF